MERDYENANRIKSESPGFARMAADNFLGNLPILICGFVVVLMLLRELFLR